MTTQKGRRIITVSLDLLSAWLKCAGNRPGRVTSTDAPKDMKVLAVYMTQPQCVQTSFKVVVESEEWATVSEGEELPQFTPIFIDEVADAVSA